MTRRKWDHEKNVSGENLVMKLMILKKRKIV